MGGDVVGDVDAELDSTDVLGEVVLVDSKASNTQCTPRNIRLRAFSSIIYHRPPGNFRA
jgi:hypothetical protein